MLLTKSCLLEREHQSEIIVTMLLHLAVIAHAEHAHDCCQH